MSIKKQENINKLNQLKDKIITSDTTIANCKEFIAYLDNEKKQETTNCLKMIKTFSIGGILCLIVASIIGETFLILPGIFPIGIGLPTASTYLAIETLLINIKKRQQQKIIINTEMEKTHQIEELEIILENLKKQELQKVKSTYTIELTKKHQEEMIDTFISNLVEAKRYDILDETLHDIYNISDPEIINLCKEIIDEELKLQRAIFKVNNNLPKIYTK